MLGLLVLLVQCQRRPGDVISRDKMKEVTKDMMLAQTYVESQYNMPDSIKEAYFRSVLDTHGLTEAKYDSSLAWYGANLPLLTNIYNQIIEEMKAEAILLDTLYQDSIRKAGLTYKPLESLWEGSSRVYLARDLHYYFTHQDLVASSLVEGDTLDLSLTLLPSLMDDESLEIDFITLSQDSSIIKSDRSRWTRIDGSKMRAYYVIPADTTGGQTQWHRIMLTYTRDSKGDRPVPLLIDSLFLSKREPPVLEEITDEEEGEDTSREEIEQATEDTSETLEEEL